VSEPNTPAEKGLPLSFLRSDRLDRCIRALAPLEDTDKLAAGAELLTRLLEDLEALTGYCWTIKVALGLEALPDQEIPEPERAPLLGALPPGRHSKRRAMARERASRRTA